MQLGCVERLPPWSPTTDVDGATTVDEDGTTLRAVGPTNGTTSVVSRDPAVSVSFRIGSAGAQRNIGLAVGRKGTARRIFVLIADVDNRIYAGDGSAAWDVHPYMHCRAGDVLKLEYRQGQMFYLKNGEEVCRPRLFPGGRAKDLYAYASIHQSGGEILDLSFDPA